MVQLDLKKLSKGMHLQDKLKLLFQDMNKQADTAGKESILTPQERQAIIDDARKTGEIREIRRVNELHKTAMFISLDMEINELLLYLSISQLEKTIIGIILKGAAEDIVGEMIYDLARQEKQSQTDFEEKSKELRIKYKVDSILFKGFDLFNPPIEDETIKKSNSLVPNQDIQKSFIVSFRHAKKLKKKLYEMTYISSKSPIDMLPESSKKLIKDSEELLTLFCNLDSWLKPLRVYRDFDKIFSKNGDNEQNIVFPAEANTDGPHFIEVIHNVGIHVELSDGEKESIAAEIDKSQIEDLY